MSDIGYKRVSTGDQKTLRQLEGVTLDKVFEDKASGKDTKRPGSFSASNIFGRGIPFTFIVSTA